MAFNVTLYSRVSKRTNSTKLPTGGGTTFAGVLKEGCSIFTPSVLIEASNLAHYNYAHIPAFERYYFITDIESVNGLWMVHMKVDVLATYRTQISSMIVYAERSEYDFDGSVVDTQYPGKTTLAINDITLQTTYHRVAPSDGSFVVGIVNKYGAGQAGGAVTYYVMNPAQINSLMAYLLSSQFLDDNGFPTTMTALQQISHDVAKCLVKPMEYIVSCIWFPYSINGTPTTVTLGYYDFGNSFQAQKMTEFVSQMAFAETIPQHPQAATRGEYLNHSPYTDLTVRVAPFGAIPLSADYIGASGALQGLIYVDNITGKGHLRITIDGHIAAEATAMFGIPIQLSQITPDWLGALSSAVGAGLSVISGNVGGAISGIGNALDSATPSPRTEGVNGSFLTEIVPPILSVKHTLLTDERKNEFGRPLCQNRTVDTIPGYIKCGAVPEDAPGMEQEKQEIKSLMMGGFFFE